jgi:hypothetical protein
MRKIGLFLPLIVSSLFAACTPKSDSSAGAGGSGGGDSSFPTCTYEDATSGTYCGCSFSPPVDLAAVSGTVTLWPFGVHAQSGHVEGHRGLDFATTIATPVNVYAPETGTIANIDNSQDSSGGMATEYDLADTAVRYTSINMDCGVKVVFIPLKLANGLTVGSRVSKGQLIGTLPQMLPPYGPNRWSTHFEIDAKASVSDSALYALCPANYFTGGEVTTLNSMLTASTYSEKNARTVSITCDDASTISMTYGAENQLCNARLSSGDRATLAACIVNRASSIW